MQQTVDIFYKSYGKDLNWLYYSLKSIEKYLTGYSRVIVVFPENEGRLIDYSRIPQTINITIVFEKEYGDGYLFQQFIKMSAHKYSSADFILYADSDCIFDKSINIQDLILNGAPEILYTDYSKVGDAICWKQCTDQFMNESQQFEFMRRLPLIYHRSTIETIFNLIPDLEKRIMESGRWSEFNCFGAWAFRHEPGKYRFVNTDHWTYRPPISRQFWSHSGLNNQDIHEINQILK